MGKGGKAGLKDNFAEKFKEATDQSPAQLLAGIMRHLVPTNPQMQVTQPQARTLLFSQTVNGGFSQIRRRTPARQIIFVTSRPSGAPLANELEVVLSVGGARTTRSPQAGHEQIPRRQLQFTPS